MADKQEIVLSAEQEELFSEVELLVLSAVSARCEGCSTANFAPKRIAGAVARGNFSEAGAAGIAARLADCPGLFDAMCHYPSGASAPNPS